MIKRFKFFSKLFSSCNFGRNNHILSENNSA